MTPKNLSQQKHYLHIFYICVHIFIVTFYLLIDSKLLITTFVFLVSLAEHKQEKVFYPQVVCLFGLKGLIQIWCGVYNGGN